MRIASPWEKYSCEYKQSTDEGMNLPFLSNGIGHQYMPTFVLQGYMSAD